MKTFEEFLEHDDIRKFKDILTWQAGYEPRHTDKLLNEWWDAKKDLIRLFGDLKIEGILDGKEINEETDSEDVTSTTRNDVRELTQLCRQVYNNSALARALANNTHTPELVNGYVNGGFNCSTCGDLMSHQRNDMLGSIDSYSDIAWHEANVKATGFRMFGKPLCICSNTFWQLMESIIVTTPPELLKNNQTQSGMRLSKYIKTIIPNLTVREQYAHRDEFKPDLHTLFDLFWSMFIQSIKESTGDVVVSLSPLDYITMSETNSWSSCHAMEGCHCAGGLSYMTDSATAIAYRPSVTRFTRFDVSLQHKTWRQVVHIYPKTKIALYGRHYPNADPSIAKLVRKMINDLFTKHYDLPDKWVLKRGIPMNLEYSGLIYGETHDTGVMTHRRGIEYRYRMVENSDGTSGIRVDENYYVGSEFPCAICGGEVTDCGSIFCCETHASKGFQCDCCGERYSYDEERHEIGDDTVCQSCYDEYYFYCRFCCETYHNDNGMYVDSREEMVCDGCIDDLFFKCDACDEYYHEDCGCVETQDDSRYCESCGDYHVINCAECGDNIRRDMTYEVGDESYCKSCYCALTTESEAV